MTSRVELHPETGGVRAVVTGAITEATELARIDAAGAATVEIDLGGVDRVNSYGVREWINLVRALGQRGTRVKLARVSVAMVRQMNMIPQVRGGAEVLSVFAPYFCERCDDERVVLLDADARAPIAASCPSCGAPMEFDDAPDGYFAFRGDERGRA